MADSVFSCIFHFKTTHKYRQTNTEENSTPFALAASATQPVRVSFFSHSSSLLVYVYSFQSIVCDEEYAAEQKKKEKKITNRFHIFIKIGFQLC
jgi:hypothetical protein